MARDEITWLSTREAAGQLGITTRTLYRLIDSGQLPAYKFGRVIRLKEHEVESFVEGARIGSSRSVSARITRPLLNARLRLRSRSSRQRSPSPRWVSASDHHESRSLVLWHAISVTSWGQAAWVWVLVGVVVLARMRWRSSRVNFHSTGEAICS